MIKYENFIPTLTLMIVVQNEERVVEEKFKLIVSSDNSTDVTNKIVEDFIKGNKLDNYSLFKVKERNGKINVFIINDAESSYWDLDLTMKRIESDIY